MEIIVGMGIVGLLGFFFGAIKVKKLNNQHELNQIEAEKQSQLAIDGQRYEKIREILTESIIDGQPAALEALKPLVEVVANQMQSREQLQLKKLEHEQRLELIRMQNGPLNKWMDQLNCMRIDMNNNLMRIDNFERAIDKMATSTEKVFGISLQQTLPANEDKKALPESTNSQ